MVAWDGSGSIHALRMRVTRLTAAGAPLVGANGMYTTSALTKFSFQPEYLEGDEVEEKNGAGDLLFAISNLARKLGIEPEAALRRANEKFTRRFDAVERAFASRGQLLSDATLEEMEAEWQRVKDLPR